MKKKLVLGLSLLFPLFTAPTLTSCGGGGIPGDIDYDNADWKATNPDDFLFDYSRFWDLTPQHLGFRYF